MTGPTPAGQGTIRGPFRRSWTGLPTNSPTTTRWSPTDRRLTFAELRDEVRRAAAAMIDLGVGAGDRVAIWSPNTWHWVVACLATTYAGGVLVPLNTRYTASEASRHPGPHRRAAAVRIR